MGFNNQGGKFRKLLCLSMDISETFSRKGTELRRKVLPGRNPVQSVSVTG